MFRSFAYLNEKKILQGIMTGLKNNLKSLVRKSILILS